MTATAHQMRLFDNEVHAPVSRPSFGLGPLLGLGLIMASWALIAVTIWALT